MADQDDRTEAPSSRRLQQARDEGQVPVSREASPLAVLAAAALVLLLIAPAALRDFCASLAAVLEQAGSLSPQQAIAACVSAGLRVAAPFAVAALVAGCAATLAQTGLLLRPAALLPDFGRLDPRKGLSRIFGPRALLETVKSLAKLGFVGWAAWSTLSHGAAAGGGFVAMLDWPAGLLPDGAARAVLRVLMAVLAAQAVIAGADIAWTRFSHARQLRMSKQELKEENRETEGDPLIKRRIRQIRMQRARRRMMEAVPKATLVVVNPTHYAVALAYTRGSTGAPRVVAKGLDTLAARIREIAAEHAVPVVTNPPLARALWRVELDAEIPAEHFQAVAEIISYLWRLRAPSGRAR